MVTQFVSETPLTFVLPDLLTICPYPLRLNPYLGDILRGSDRWLVEVGGLSEDRLAQSKAAKTALLCATHLPDADSARLRVYVDYLAWLFNVDDCFDDYDLGDARTLWQTCMTAFRDPNLQTDKRSALMIKSFFERFRQIAGPACTERLIRGLDLFFAASEREVECRIKGNIADLESYIAYRRDTSGTKASCAMIEYAAGFDLPDEVASHPVIIAMVEATNDMIGWSNDIYSFNKEQAQGDIHNLVMILMHKQGLDLQDAMDQACAHWKAALQRFEDNVNILPTWGSDIDQNVAIYVQGLRDMVVGSLHWSFDAERYFGKEGQRIKKDRIVKLLPKKTM